MTRLLLIRHAEAEGGGVYTGSSDPSLSALGKRQARALAKHVQRFGPAAVYSSRKRRAKMTADEISRAGHIRVRAVKGLEEIDFGEWEGKTFREIDRKYGARFRKWVAGAGSYRAPGGERLREMQGRVLSALRRILKANRGSTVAVVCHGGPARIIICEALGLPLRNFWKIKQDNAALNVVEYYGKGLVQVCLVNETSYPGISRKRKTGA